jgi:hypothetical protein
LDFQPAEHRPTSLVAQLFLPALSEVEGAVFLGFSFLSVVIPTGMADFLFRSRRANIVHGARSLRPACFTGTEGPRQRFNLSSALEISKSFWSVE